MNRILSILLILTHSVVFAFEQEADNLQALDEMVLKLEQDQYKEVNKGLYQIEILCFEHKKSPDLKEQFSNDIGRLDFSYAKEIIDPIVVTTLQLGEIKQQLSTDNSYKILLHTAWRQILNFAIKSHSMLIESQNLRGTIRVKTVRDLQVIADLVFSKHGKDYRMQQTWHLDRNKVYYFDHPKFGFFIKIYK